MKKVVDVLMVLCVVAVIGFTIYSFYEGGTSVCTADGAQECPAIYENKIVKRRFLYALLKAARFLRQSMRIWWYGLTCGTTL
jgi:hypothetical protein